MTTPPPNTTTPLLRDGAGEKSPDIITGLGKLAENGWRQGGGAVSTPPGELDVDSVQRLSLFTIYPGEDEL